MSLITGTSHMPQMPGKGTGGAVKRPSNADFIVEWAQAVQTICV